MIREDKELLLADLCGRLPYGVKVLDNSHKNYGVSKLINIGLDGSMLIDNEINDIQYYPIIDDVKPYLRPMSSMTEEESDEFQQLDTECDKMPTFDYVSIEHYRIFDWLNAHHFDYRGLIERGLAIAVTEDNNPYKS